MIGDFPAASYDAWKTCSPDDDRDVAEAYEAGEFQTYRGWWGGDPTEDDESDPELVPVTGEDLEPMMPLDLDPVDEIRDLIARLDRLKASIRDPMSAAEFQTELAAAWPKIREALMIDT